MSITLSQYWLKEPILFFFIDTRCPEHFPTNPEDAQSQYYVKYIKSKHTKKKKREAKQNLEVELIKTAKSTF